MHEPHPVQLALKPGDHWVSFEVLDQGVVIWGQVDEVKDEYLASTAYWTELPGGRREIVLRPRVWPIEERLFEMAREANWNHNRLEEIGRFLLNLAFAQHRVYLLPSRSE